MEIDLIRDMDKIVAKRWLEQHNIPTPANERDNFLEFLRWYRLQIPKIPRKVFISKELGQSKKFKKHKKVIMRLKKKFENGEDVMPFTSNRKKPTFKNHNPNNDYLLNDWNIHHFHLKTRLSKNNKIKRSNDLLFCFIDENNNNVYFLNIYPHFNEDKSNNWSNKDLLEIIDNNWGDVLEADSIETVPDIILSDKEIREMRRSGINSAVTISNGKTFLLPGGGYTVDGNSARVTNWSISVGEQLKKIENMFKKGEIKFDYTIECIQLTDCSFEINKWNIRLTKLLFLVNGEREFEYDTRCQQFISKPFFPLISLPCE